MQVLNTTNNTIGQELFNIFSQENFDTALKYPIRFAEELGIAFDQIEETLTDINLDFDDKLNLKTVKDQIKALQSTIPEIIQSATGLDNAFNRVFTANDADELEQAQKVYMEDPLHRFQQICRNMLRELNKQHRKQLH